MINEHRFMNSEVNNLLTKHISERQVRTVVEDILRNGSKKNIQIDNRTMKKSPLERVIPTSRGSGCVMFNKLSFLTFHYQTLA